MRRLAGLLALAGASLALTAWRYGRDADADARLAAGLVARLTAADMVLVAVETMPALRVLHLRRIGCETGWRLAFAPDDGEAESALARLLPGGAILRLDADSVLRPGWILVADVPAEACLAPRDAAALLRDTKG